MSELTLENLRAELAPIRQQLDALPPLRRAIDGLQHDTGDLRTAFNEFARTQVTPGDDPGPWRLYVMARSPSLRAAGEAMMPYAAGGRMGSLAPLAMMGFEGEPGSGKRS